MNPELISLDISNISGALFIGFMVSIALHGWLLSQTVKYFHVSRCDHKIVISVVLLLVVLETAGTIGAAQGFYVNLITNFGNLFALNNIAMGFKVYYLCTPISICIVQLFFVYRLHRVSEGSFIEMAMILLSLFAALAACALGLVTAGAAIRLGALSSLNRPFYQNITAAMSGLSATCDAVITWALCRQLSTLRNGFASTERTVSSIGSYVLNRGIILLAVQIAAFIALLIHSQLHAFLFFEVMLAKLYANSLISFLVAFEPQKLQFRSVPSAHNHIVEPLRDDPARRNIRLEVTALRETCDDQDHDLTPTHTTTGKEGHFDV